MSVATAITDLSARIQGAFAACEAKGPTGVTMPEQRTTHTLSSCIDSIAGFRDLIGEVQQDGSLVRPTTGEPYDFSFDGVKSLSTQTATYSNASNAPYMAYLFANNQRIRNVYFPDLEYLGQSIPRLLWNSSATSLTFSKLSVSTVTTVQLNAFSLSGLYCPELLSATNFGSHTNSAVPFTAFVEFYVPKLRYVGPQGMYQTMMHCTNYQNVNFPELTAIGDNGMASFHGMTNATLSANQPLSVFMPKLETIGAYGMQYFWACVGYGGSSADLRNLYLDIHSLKSVGDHGMEYAFYYARDISNYKADGTIDYSVSNGVIFPELSSAGNYAFQNILFPGTYMWYQFHFPKLVQLGANTFTQMVGSNKAIRIHFGAANEQTLKADPNYATMWGANISRTTLYFDL